MTMFFAFYSFQKRLKIINSNDEIICADENKID